MEQYFTVALAAAPEEGIVLDLEHERQWHLSYSLSILHDEQGRPNFIGPELDPTSGLEMRWHFIRYVEQALQDANAAKCQVGLIILDIDGFIYFNDKFSHRCGDALLRTLAFAFREVVRGKGMLARIGGDEIAVAIPNATSEEIERLAFDLRAAGGQVMVDADGIAAGPITLTAGMVISPDHGTTCAELMEAASSAIDQKYRIGRDRAVWPPL